MLQGVGGFGVQAPVLGGLRPLSQAFRGFGVKLLRHRCGAALFADPLYHHLMRYLCLPNGQYIPHTYLLGGLEGLLAHEYMATVDGFSGQ